MALNMPMAVWENIVPIADAINLGATIIDVIILKTEKPDLKKRPLKNAFELTTRTFDFILYQIIVEDILIGKLISNHNKVNLNFYHPTGMLTKNSLIFERDLI
jgi:hypothetical protein